MHPDLNFKYESKQEKIHLNLKQILKRKNGRTKQRE